MFAVAGAIAAAGPVVIHLFNRRRFRVVHWGAMDFLRDAFKRNKRIVQLRDILLLILRTVVVLLFGLALARPYFSRDGGGQADPGQPLHVVLIVDNSMSMGYRQGGGTLLDEAKARGRQVIEALPDGSRTTVLPLCGGGSFSHDPYRTRQDAIEALNQIEVVDRAGTAARAADLAREAIGQTADAAIPQRVVFLGDQQLENWKGPSLEPHLAGLPTMQVVDGSAAGAENTWISDFRLLDGLADVATPARFLAQVRHQGHSPRPHMQVTLSIDGAEAQSKMIDLLPDQTAEVAFDYQFTDPPEPGDVRWSSARVSLPPDRLEIDDSRSLVVPVVAALPVVFVDQYGDAEDPKRNRFGETRNLRGLLAPQTARGQSQSRLVRIVRRRIDELEQRDLRDARLVVIAGVPRPESAETVKLLRDYVEQGGQLILAAGAEFDPAAWTDLAWLDGAGILPLPLKPQPLGHTPDEAARDLKVFSLKVDVADVSNNPYLQLPQTDPQDVVDSLREPTFFKAIVPVEEKEGIDKLLATETRQIEDRRKQLTDVNAEIQKLSEKELHGKLDAAERATLVRDQRLRGEILPDWLLFGAQRAADDAERPAAELADRSRPRVVLRYDNQTPFLVERDIGRGRVELFTSGMFSNWNDLPRQYAVWLLDRVMRSRIEATLPVRNVDTSAAPVFVPIRAGRRGESFVLVRPDGKRQPLEVERRGPDEFGVVVSNFSQRGVYRVEMLRPPGPPATPADKLADHPPEPKLPVELIAANGPADESKLASIDEAGLSARMKESGDTQPARYVWVPRGQPISLSGGEVWGEETWWWLVLAILLCLFAELTILAWPALAARREAAAALSSPGSAQPSTPSLSPVP